MTRKLLIPEVLFIVEQIRSAKIIKQWRMNKPLNKTARISFQHLPNMFSLRRQKMIGPQEKLSVDLSQVVAISLVRPDGKAVARIALTQDISLLLPAESRVSLSLHTKARSILMVNTMPVGWPTRKKLLGVRKVISVVQ